MNLMLGLVVALLGWFLAEGLCEYFRILMRFGAGPHRRVLYYERNKYNHEPWTQEDYAAFRKAAVEHHQSRRWFTHARH